MPGPITTTIDLDPAEILYLNKLLLRKRADIPAEVSPLPSFAWRMDKLNAPDVSDRELTKGFMRALAMSWRAVRKPHEGDAFVALVQVSPDAAHYSIHLHCPFADVVDGLRDPSGRKRIAENTAVRTLDVQHKYGLVAGRVCPVVFAWRPDTEDVLVTNEFHFENSAQFIAIDRVTTTSGFLNFIGALSLLDHFDQYAQSFAARVNELLRDGINHRTDEWLRWLLQRVQEQVLLDPARLLVDAKNPEHYYYDYSSKFVGR
jgi:hypothetical protein